MKILSRDQIYAADHATLKSQEITSMELMERAALAAFNELHEILKKTEKLISVFCGVDNNGGDGLVISRLLLENGYTITTYIVQYNDTFSEDCESARKRLEKHEESVVHVLKSSLDLPKIHESGIIIDAIFGIGYNRPAAEWIQELFTIINKSGNYVVSIDIASGLYLDAIPKEGEQVIAADMLLTFQVPKLVIFLPQSGKYIKKFKVLDIQLDCDYIQKAESAIEVIGASEIKKIYRTREKFTHKGTFGHSLIVGGSYGKMGAAILASKACLHAGSGLVTAYIPKFGMPIMQISIPEAMVLVDRHDGKCLEEIDFELDADAIGIGMGMGTEMITARALRNFLKTNKKQLVVDADALNIISKNTDLLAFLPEKTVITPHPKELERLIGSWKDDFEKIEKVKVFSAKNKLVIVLKGANTMIIDHDKIFINSTGNPGMATGGTGDVLTGIITALIAQKYTPLDAAILGVYLHGKAGDLAAFQVGYEALNAGDVIENLGKAFLSLSEKFD